MKRLLLFYLFYSTASVSLFAGEGILAKVVSVIDGNTIEIINGNEKQTVVIAEIDCPELEQEYGIQAKNFLEKLILKKNVSVKFKGKDRSGNYLAVVMLGHDDLRIALLKEGLAWTSEKNPSEDLEPYRMWAEKKGRGLWKQPNPMPPWTYRRQQSMTQPKSS